MRSFLILALFIGSLKIANAMNLPAGELVQIGQKIYQNECASKPENLMHWNANESFASMGIGHFIWFSEVTNQTDLRFEEQFPELVRFISQHQTLPAGLNWLTGSAPWNSKQAFLQFKHNADSSQLKQWLIKTQSLQAQFIWSRFLKRLTRLKSQNDLKKPEVSEILHQMLRNPKTRFALVDYVNFKGWGDNLKERYQNQGWGLLQVLEKVALVRGKPDRPVNFQQLELLELFVHSAKQVLDNRIKNAPSSKNEEAWRSGWHARVNRYL
ncbi:hypothetical protein [Thiomicrorhabdus indica]|uniref:hypothetical protein n=1 Tax=Thiomicrorhabdus indica TaxID=2267253 RepID=UPI002AA6DB0C|nr:hypothetical protein [Thiomicrorhabdus indica]